MNNGLLSQFAQANDMTISEAAKYLMDNKDNYSMGGSVGYANGGGVDPDFEKNELAKIEAKRKENVKRLGEAQARRIAEEARQELNAKIYNSLSQQLKDKDKAKKDLDRAQKEYDAVLKSYNDYVKESDFEQNRPLSTGEKYTTSKKPSSESVLRNREDLLRQLNDKKSSLNKAKKDLDFANNESNYISGNRKNVNDSDGINYMTGKNFKNNVKQFDNTTDLLKQTPSIAPATTNPVKRQNKPLQSISNTGQVNPLSGDIFSRDWSKINEGPSEVPATIPSNTQMASNNPYKYGNTVNGVDPNQAAYDRDLAAALNNNNQPISKKKFDFSNVLGNAVNYGIPALQTAIGLRNLKAAGNRPKDQLDVDYLQALNKEKQNVLKAEALGKYGFNPEERAYLDMQNQNITNAGRYNARNLTGGSSANALGAERAVLNDSFGRALQTQVNDRNLQLQKQYAAMDRQENLNNLVQDKQNRLRQYFGDDLTAFHQKTQSAANLINTGLSNAIDSYRADERLKNFNNQTQQPIYINYTPPTT